MNLLDTIYNLFWISVYIGIVIAFLGGIFYLISLWRRKVNEKKHAYNLTFLQVKLPKENEIEIKAGEQLFSSLVGFKKDFPQSLFSEQYRISFEIVSKSSGIGFYVVVPDEIASLVEKQINGAYPSAEIDIVNPQEVWDRGDVTDITELKLKGPAYYPIRVYEDLKGDSLNPITSAMSKLKEDEVVAIQYVIRPAPDNWRSAGRRFINDIKNKTANPEKKVNIDTSFLEGVEKKIANAGFYTKIRIVSISKDKLSAQSHIQNVMSAFEQFTNINYNRFVKKVNLVPSKINLVNNFIYRKIGVIDVNIPILGIPIYSNTSVLNTEEMGTIFHFPNKEIETPNIMWLDAKSSAAPTDLPESGLYLGKSIFRGVEKDIFMKEEDRVRHFYILGQTGTGKSQFMMLQAIQDIYAGNGLAIIDPHGTDVDELLEKIPPERENDVILFDAGDTERPIGINLLEAHSEEEKHMAINAFIELLYKLYDPNKQGIMGPQLERALRNSMLTAMVDPESTMADVVRMLVDENYAKKFLDRVTDPFVKDYWINEVAKTTQNRKGEVMGYFVSKLDRFVTERTMRNIVGQPKSGFNFEQVMAEKKILLIDLAKGKIGEENSNFIGLILVPKILSAALARHKYVGKEEFPHFYLYVDEFQNFATPAFATILSEARKYKLNLTVAHQFISQLDEKIKDAVFGNVGTKAIFRTGSEDAEFLETYFSPTFTKEDLSKLSTGNCYMQLLVDGQPTRPFSMRVDWNKINSYPKDPKRAQRIRENSKLKYGTPIAEIDKYIEQRLNAPQETQKESLPPLPGILQNISQNNSQNFPIPQGQTPLQTPQRQGDNKPQVKLPF